MSELCFKLTLITSTLFPGVCVRIAELELQLVQKAEDQQRIENQKKVSCYTAH